jgi:hypothetical protein
MSHHIMLFHLSSLKNNLKIKEITSYQVTFLYLKINLKIQVACHITSCYISFFY